MGLRDQHQQNGPLFLCSSAPFHGARDVLCHSDKAVSVVSEHLSVRLAGLAKSAICFMSDFEALYISLLRIMRYALHTAHEAKRTSCNEYQREIGACAYVQWLNLGCTHDRV